MLAYIVMAYIVLAQLVARAHADVGGGRCWRAALNTNVHAHVYISMHTSVPTFGRMPVHMPVHASVHMPAHVWMHMATHMELPYVI